MTEERVRLLGITCVVTECITCGVPFTVPLMVHEQHRKHGGYHHCPNGHSQGWSQDRSQEGRERKELERLRQQQARWEDERRALEAQTEQERRRAAAARGQITKLKKRASAGICPCCNRSFSNLQRHMANQHPSFMQEPDATEHVH